MSAHKPFTGDQTHGTVPKVAAHCGVDEDRLRRAIRAGKVRTHPPAEGKGPALVALADVLAWIAAEGIAPDL